MFKRYKRKILKEVLNELSDLKEYYDIVIASKQEIGSCDDFDLGIGSGIRKSLSKIYEMYYDNVMTKERAEKKFGIIIVEDEPYSEKCHNEIILNQHLCRGKRTDNNEWVYGYYVAVPEEYSHGKDIVHAIFTTECEHICMGEYKDHGWYEVIPDSVGRYTGLDDKNFHPIFENDIVKNSKGEIGEIVWFGNIKAGTSFSINYITRYADGEFFKPQDMMLDIVRRDIEIIGNIIDNPKLVGGNYEY